MLLAPPHVSYIIGFCTMWRRPGHRKNLWQSFLVVARAELVAPPVCPLAPPQFVHSPLPYFSTGFLSFRISYFFSTALGLICKVGCIQCDWLWWKGSALMPFKIRNVFGLWEMWRMSNGDAKYYWLLVFPISHMLKFAQLQWESYKALRIAVIH